MPRLWLKIFAAARAAAKPCARLRRPGVSGIDSACLSTQNPRAAVLAWRLQRLAGPGSRRRGCAAVECLAPTEHTEVLGLAGFAPVFVPGGPGFDLGRRCAENDAPVSQATAADPFGHADLTTSWKKMNSAPRRLTATEPPHAALSPEQRLATSRLQMAQALREPWVVLLLKRLLGQVGTSCAQTSPSSPPVAPAQNVSTASTPN